MQRRGSADPRSFRVLYLIVAALLTAVLTLSIQLTAARGEGEPASETEAPIARTELPEERTATSNTYLLDSGALQTELFSSPVNYETDSGDWKPIDEGLEETPAGGITNSANSFDLQLPEEMGAGSVVRLSEDGAWISYRYLGAATDAAEVDGATATYEASSGALSFELQSMSDGLKENIVLDSASQPSEYRFALDLSDGLTPELLEDGSIAIREADGTVFAALPAPVISDSSGGLTGPASAVHYQLEPAPEGKWMLSVIASEEWLSDPARQFPVTLDPSVKVLNTTLDCDLGSTPLPKGWHECGTTGAKELMVAYSQKEKQPVRTFLRFPISGSAEKVSGPLNKNVYVSNAVLGLYAPAAAENTTGLETRRVTKSWDSSLNWKSPAPAPTLPGPPLEGTSTRKGSPKSSPAKGAPRPAGGTSNRKACASSSLAGLRARSRTTVSSSNRTTRPAPPNANRRATVPAATSPSTPPKPSRLKNGRS